MLDMRFIVGTMCLCAIVLEIRGDDIHFDPNYLYKYEYNSTFTLNGIKDFVIRSKMDFLNIAEQGEHEELYMKVDDYIFAPSDRNDIVGHDLDLEHWFSFVLSKKGEISDVFYSANEPNEVVSLKKGLASLLSGKFLYAHEADEKDSSGNYSYTTEEVGHEGKHKAMYKVGPTAYGKLYSKGRIEYKHPVPNARSDMQKSVFIDKTLGTVHTITVSEVMEILQKPNDSFNPFHGMRKVESVNKFDTLLQQYPTMKVFSEGTLTFIERKKVVNMPRKPKGLKKDVIHHASQINPTQSRKRFGRVGKPENTTLVQTYVRTNLTCIRQQPRTGSQELLDCSSKLADTLFMLPDEELEKTADHYLNQTQTSSIKEREDQYSFMDALWMVRTRKSQQLLAKYVLLNQNVEEVLLQRLLYQIASATQPPHTDVLHFFEMLIDTSEEELYNTYDDETIHIFLLSLGAICNVLNEHGDKDRALKFISRIKDMIGVHDPWSYRQTRSTLTEEEQIKYDLRRVVLLEALGNGRHESSYEHIVSHINSTNSPWIKRSAVHALRHYHHQEAADVMLQAAVYDESEEVRYDAMLQYQAHPHALSIPQHHDNTTKRSVQNIEERDGQFNIQSVDDSPHSRRRRGVLDAQFRWRLEAPSVDWRKFVGSSSIGGSFGVIMINYFDLKISPLSGWFKIEVHDEVYARAHLGILGLNFDYFHGRICFKGGAKYNLNLLQEYDPRLGAESLKLLTEGLKDVVQGIKTGIDIITNIINGKFSFKAIVEDFLQAFRELPDRVLDLSRTASSVMKELGELTVENLPPFIVPVQKLVDHVTNLFNDIKTDVMDFYNLLVQSIETVIPNAADRIFTSVKGILKEFPNIFKDPKTSVASIGKGVVSIKLAIKELQSTRKKIEDSSFVKGEKPYWMDIESEFGKIADMAKKAIEAVYNDGKKWIESISENEDPILKLTDGVLSERKIRDIIVQKIDAIIQSIMNPFDDLKDLGHSLFDQFVKLFGLVSDMKEGYNKLKTGFRDARAIIDTVFGPKCHKDFPKLIREDACTGNGFFPSRLGVGNEYNFQGVDLVVKEDVEVVAPFSGSAILTGQGNEVKITDVTELPTGQEIVIMNIKPNGDIYNIQDTFYEEKRVTAGDVVGYSTKSECTNHIHFVLLQDGKVIDPSSLLAPRPPEIPEWKQYCDDYKIVLKGITRKAGVIVGVAGRKTEDTSGHVPNDGTVPDTLDESQAPPATNGGAMYDNLNRRRRKRNDFINQTLSKLDALVERTSAFLEQFSIRRIKMGAIVEFLNKLNMEESKKQMAVVIKRIKEAIEDAPCETPSQMTEDEIRIQLLNRGLVPSGSREQMLKTMTTSDKRCSMIALGMLDIENMYCSYDEECLGIQCCLTLTVGNLLQKSYKGYIQLVPEDLQLKVGFGDWEKQFTFLGGNNEIEDTIATGVKFNLVDLEVICSYKIEKTDASVLLTFGCGLCTISDNDVCLDMMYLLQDALFPLPSFQNGSLTWPVVNYEQYLDRESVKKRLTDAGEELLERGKQSIADELLSILGIPKDYLKTNPPCPIPENMLDADLTLELSERKMSTDGTRVEQELRLRLFDRTCTSIKGDTFVLPEIKDKTDIFYYKVTKQCLRIDACLDVTLPGIEVTKTFTAAVELDPCDFKLNISIEKWKKSIWLVDYSWGVESQLKLTDNIYMRYAIDKDETTNEFVISIGLVCSAIAFEKTFVDEQRIPIPVCNADFKLPGTGDIKSFAEALGGEMTREAFDIFAASTGIDVILNMDVCKLPPDPEGCSIEVSDFIPDILSDIVHCKMLDNCWGVSCCLDFGFTIPFSKTRTNVSIPFMFKYDPCEYYAEYQIGPKHLMKHWFVDYKWGEQNVFTVGKGLLPPVNITYKVTKFEEGFTIDATLTICLPLAGDDVVCIPEGRPLNLLENEHVPLCYLGLDDINGNYPNFSLGDWLGERGRKLGDEIGQAGKQYILETLNIEHLMMEHTCNRKKSPYSPSVNGWNMGCNGANVNTFSMPDSVSCHVTEDCMRVSCCIDVPYINISVKVDINVNLCDNSIMAKIEESFDRLDDALSNYEWGKYKEVSVGNAFKAKYKLEKPARDWYMVDLSVAACFERSGDCLFNASIIKGLSIPRIYCTDTKESCTRLLDNITHQCAMDADCQGITCDVDVDDATAPLTTYVRISNCLDELIYTIGKNKRSHSLSTINDDSVRSQQISNDITMQYKIDESATSFYVSVNITVCNSSRPDSCQTIEVFSNLSLQKGMCTKSSHVKRRSIELDSLNVPDFKTGLKDMIQRKASNFEISQYMDDAKYFQQMTREKVLKAISIDEDDVKTSIIGAVKALGANNPMTIPHVQKSMTSSGWNVEITGENAIMDLMSGIEGVVGKAEQTFIIGKGLTPEGIKLLGKQLANMTIGDLEALLEVNKVDPVVIHQLTLDLVNLATALYSEAIEVITSSSLKNAFESFELTVRGNFPFPRTADNLYAVGIPFPLGPVQLWFEFGSDYYFGIDVGVGIRVLSMVTEANVKPYGGLNVWGSVSVGSILYAKLELVGYIMQIQFPTYAELGFSKFPLDVGLRMDLVMVPLQLQLNGLVTLEIKLTFIRIKKVLFKATIWRYRTPSIAKEIFNKVNEEKDDTPPSISGLNTDGVNKRSSTGAHHCDVKQLPDRDYTEPAFQISVKAVDDKSQINYFLDVGTTPGGTDTLNEFALGGALTKLAMNLKHTGVPLYFTMHAQNSQGTRSSVTCQLQSYDVTVPSGRLQSDFSTSSNPSTLRASAVAHDEYMLTESNMAIGFGEGIYGDQISPWHKVDLTSRDYAAFEVDDAEQILVHFSGMIDGRLIGGALISMTGIQRVSHCAQMCLERAEHSCLSINYDFGVSGHCELLKAIEGHDHAVAKDGLYSHYERLGIGNAVEVEKTDAPLLHNYLYEYNLEMTNALGYNNIITTKGILIDFTTPEPGLVLNNKDDYLEFKECLDLIPEDRPDWERFCVGVDSSIKNHRVVVDGVGSRTVFNGMVAMIDLNYTRINNYIAANWDGFHDNETGIRGYTWAIGKTFCEDMIHPHLDPNRHLLSKKHWTNAGSIYPIPAPYTTLPDGHYYVTVRALNLVEFGGPLTLSVCHTAPFVVDTSHPLINEIYDIKYDERSNYIYAAMNISDPQSGILEYDICLGTTSRTCDMLPWYRYDYALQLRATHRFKIPDGQPAWLRFRAVNNVLLSTVKSADQAIIVDSTPPIAGVVNDGELYRTDIQYSKDKDKICVNWVDFYDPDSGISRFIVGIGTSQGKTDIVPSKEVHYKKHSTCLNVPTAKTLVHGGRYYAVVWAVNGGVVKRNVSAVSDGVMIDLTLPTEGEVVDGTRADFVDLKFSASKSAVSLQWKDYSDSESDIKDFRIQITDETGTNAKVIQNWTTFNKDVKSASWMNFHLKHKSYIKSILQITNGALNEIVRPTDGFLIDLTAPELTHIGDGSIQGQDIRYQYSTDNLAVNFVVDDPESGLDSLRFQIFEKQNGQKRKIWPEYEEWFERADITTTVFTKTDLTLALGAMYTVRIGAKNKAGIIGIHETNGVILDVTPPLVRWLHVGVLFGEMENIHDGYVYQSDHHGIKVSWMAFDTESGVESIIVSVGSTPGSGDIKASTEYRGDIKDVYITDIEFEDTVVSLGSMAPVYYVSITVINGAGRQSGDIVSSPIVIVPEDVPGIVIDGISQEDNIFDLDVDYQADTTTVSVTYEGFSSTLHGITSIVWAVGTTPDSENVLPFSENGVIAEDTIDETDNSISYAGFCQAAVSLEHGHHYYATVRAITNIGHVLSTVSDGFTVDKTPPIVGIDRLLDVDLTKEENITALYTSDASFLQADWHYLDPQILSVEILDNIESMSYSVGTFPFSTDMVMVTSQEITSKYIGGITDSYVELNTLGIPNFLSVNVHNKAGLVQSIHSPAVVVDKTPPQEGIVSCSSYAQLNVPVRCTWTPFLDMESPVLRYGISLGTSRGNHDVLSHKSLPENTDTYLVNEYDITPEHGHVYYATVTAYNSVGMDTSSFSGPINIDTTPPVPGVVIELSHQHVYGNGSAGTQQIHCTVGSDCSQHDAMCQESLTSVSVAWQPFIDLESDITEYYLAVGSTEGGTEVAEYFMVTPIPENTVYTIHGLKLFGLEKIYVKIMAINGAGLSSVSTSNGVCLSYLSQGLDPLSQMGVWDADPGVEGDVDFQTDTSQIHVSWDVSGDPCPALKYEWAIERIDGLVVQEFIDMTGSTSGTNDQLSMSDGETYYSLLRVINALGYQYILRSDGVTIHSQPLVPGSVYDGDIFGYDLNVVPSETMVTCNWEGFGVPKQASTEDIITGNKGTNTEPPDNQMVSHYEVALGTDRRFSSTRADIVGFTHAATNTSYTFQALSLTPGTAKYYCTVKAYCTTLSNAEVTSNGFHVTFNGGVSAGTISLPDYVTSDKTMDIQWDDFTSKEDMMLYYIAISDHNQAKDLDCKQAVDGGHLSDEEKDALFNVSPVTNVGTNTFKQLDELQLTEGQMYYVFVMGVDYAGECNMTMAATTVDTSDPVGGGVTGGPYFDVGIAYTADKTAITAKWAGYMDTVSGIHSYVVSLWYGNSCEDDTVQGQIGTDVILTSTASDFTFHDQVLKSSTPYFVKLVISNGAGLSLTHFTSPILYDDSVPTAGHVVEGTDYKSDVVWWGSSTLVTGTLLHYPSQQGQSCPSQPIQFTDQTWTAVDGPLLTNTNGELWKLIYLPQHIKLDERTGYMDIKMSKDSKSPNALSAAYSRNADFQDEGTYEISIKAAPGDGRVVTEILLMDADIRNFQSHYYGSESNLTDEYCSCCLDTPVNADCLCFDCKAYINESTKVSPTDPTGGTSKSCGFQIYTGLQPYGVTWCRFYDNKTPVMEIRSDLQFDPANYFHNYRLELVITNEDLLPDLCLNVYADNEQLSSLCGIPKLSTSTNFILHVWNSDNYLPELPYDLDSWVTYATFRDVIFPPSIGELCRYGLPFRAGAIPIVRYEAGIGSNVGDIDVAPFREVISPCLPCSGQCSKYDCNEHCDITEVETFQFDIDHLDLKPLQQVDNVTSLNVYYITVKAVLASGVYVTSSSDGFYVDMTAPVFNEAVLLYFDVDQGEYTPVEYQGSNNTIKAVWLCTDDESEITEYKWAIGTAIGTTDIQTFISTGDNPSGINHDLEGVISNKRKYYISVKCTNEAGLTTLYQDQRGVVALLEVPNPDDMTGGITGAESFGYNIEPPESMKSEDPTTIGASFEVVDDPSIRQYEFCCGSSDTVIDDIFPCLWVGYNVSGEVKIKNGYLLFNGEKMYSLNELRRDVDTDTSEAGSFRMEPGRVMFVFLRLCNLANKCGIKRLGSVTIISDRTQSGISDGHLALKFTATATKDSGSVSKRDLSDIVIDLEMPADLPAGQTLLFSQLTDAEMTTEYKSDASLQFVPYIVNPSTTDNQTERLLLDRLVTFGMSFTVVPVGQLALTGPMKITHSQVNTDPSPGDLVNMLVHWNPDNQEWMITSRTCIDEIDTESHNSSSGTTTVKVCSTRNSASNLEQRYFVTETQFAIFQVTSQILNSAPMLSSKSLLQRNEDDGIIAEMITAVDKEGDDIVFSLIQYQSNGIVDDISLSEAGSLQLKLCTHCFGIVTIDIEIKDVPEISEVQSNSSFVTITVNIASVNDPPLVFLIDDTDLSLLHADVTEEIKIYRENKEARTTSFSAIFGAYDYDERDEMVVIHADNNSRGYFSMEVIDKIYDNFKTCNSTWCFGNALERSPTQMSWVFGQLTYLKNESYTGVDTIKLAVKDATGTLSDVVTVSVYNLEAPCQNGGYCAPSTIYPCNDPARLTDYDTNYVCVCPRGWSGFHCQYDVDECLTSPCGGPTVCENIPGSYICVYAVYFIVLLSIGCVAAVVAVIIITLLYKRKAIRKRLLKMKKKGETNEISDGLPNNMVMTLEDLEYDDEYQPDVRSDTSPFSVLLSKLPFGSRSRVSPDNTELDFIHPEPAPIAMPALTHFKFPNDGNKFEEMQQDDDDHDDRLKSLSPLKRPTSAHSRPNTSMSINSIVVLPHSTERLPDDIVMGALFDGENVVKETSA